MKPVRSVNGIKDPYTRRILSNIVGRDAFRVYAATPAKLKRLLAAINSRDLQRPIAKGKWSVAQIVSHLSDAEIVMGFRYRMALAEPGCRILAYDQDKWDKGLKYNSADSRKKLDLFLANRRGNIALLRSLKAGEWKRYGMHEERGRETVERMVQMIAGHDLNHLRQIERIGKAFRARRT
jgi:hypothetical protein